MSVTEQPPPAPGPGPAGEGDGDAAAEHLRDRISADSLTTRRDYLRIVATVSGGLAIGGVGVAAGILHRHGDSETMPEAKKVADRLEPGRSVAFRFPGDEDRALAVRLADGSLVGYSAVCTHLACAVLWREDRGTEGELYCPCHEGVFDARTGEVTAGPPPRPLPRIFLTERSDGSVWALATARSGEPAKEALCRQFIDSRPEMAAQLGCPGADRVTGGSEKRRT
ncbi:ubiquinol-cytochrome c reductase iron-sulfur subunit [Streptomyces sp. NPDC091268]|uniref:QcrA and Rieske domain-containing protein n=1 Tax=Streptomyces sp. NPDC091268 TaxID=3365979 RepID=UPI00381C1175